MALFEFRCGTHGQFEDFYHHDPSVEKPVSRCPECGEMCPRIYSPPVTDCWSFGRNGYAARTPEYARKSYYEEDERKRHQMKRDLGITSKLVPKG